jgi:hypothetical protein
MVVVPLAKSSWLDEIRYVRKNQRVFERNKIPRWRWDRSKEFFCSAPED